MTVKELIDQIEYLYGKQPHVYMKRLINDALLDMSGEIQSYKASFKENLISGQKTYSLSDAIIDVERVEILNSDNKYEVIPYLSDYDQIREGDDT